MIEVITAIEVFFFKFIYSGKHEYWKFAIMVRFTSSPDMSTKCPELSFCVGYVSVVRRCPQYFLTTSPP
jgi:hypothetical protein